MMLRPRLAAMEAEVSTQAAKAHETPPEGIRLLQTCIHDLKVAYNLA